MWLLESRRESFRIIPRGIHSHAVKRCLRTGMLRYPNLFLYSIHVALGLSSYSLLLLLTCAFWRFCSLFCILPHSYSLFSFCMEL